MVPKEPPPRQARALSYQVLWDLRATTLKGVTVRWDSLPRAPFKLLQGFYFYTEFSVPEWAAVIREWERERKTASL